MRRSCVVIVAERSEKGQGTPEIAVRQWADEHGFAMVQMILEQLTPAVRQAWGSL